MERELRTEAGESVSTVTDATYAESESGEIE